MRDTRGITLIALVITIIVLLILAGVSISLLSGDNGILNKASSAKSNTEQSGVLEEIRLKLYNNELELDDISSIDYLKSLELIKEEVTDEETTNISYVLNEKKLDIKVSTGKGSYSEGDVYYFSDGDLYYKNSNKELKLLGNVYKDTEEKDIWIYEKNSEEYRIVGIDAIGESKIGSDKIMELGAHRIIVPNTHDGIPVKTVNVNDFNINGQSFEGTPKVNNIYSLTIEEGIVDFNTNNLIVNPSYEEDFEINLPSTLENFNINIFNNCNVILNFPNGMNDNINLSHISDGSYGFIPKEIYINGEKVEIPDWKYEIIDDGTIKLTDYIGTKTDVKIPSEIYGKAVTVIEVNNNNIEKLYIPGSIKMIKTGTYFSKVTQVTFESTFSGEIDENVFEHSSWAFYGFTPYNCRDDEDNYEYYYVTINNREYYLKAY